jgi:hypothetical protein
MATITPLHGAYITLVSPLHVFSLGHLLIQTLLGPMLLLLDIHSSPLLGLRLLGVPYYHRNGWLAAK